MRNLSSATAKILKKQIRKCFQTLKHFSQNYFRSISFLQFFRVLRGCNPPFLNIKTKQFVEEEWFLLFLFSLPFKTLSKVTLMTSRKGVMDFCDDSTKVLSLNSVTMGVKIVRVTSFMDDP